jgi:hypothetical protein
VSGALKPRSLLGLALISVLMGLALPGVEAWGQERAMKEAYFMAVGDHFDVPFQEVTIIGDWELAPDEVPVVLFLSKRAGVSPDALIGLRRSGRSWSEISGRFGLGPREFHMPLPEDGPLGPLARAAGAFRGRPAREWNRVQLTDDEIVAYVNVRFLSERVHVTPIRVLEAQAAAGSFMAAYPRLRDR